MRERKHARTLTALGRETRSCSQKLTPDAHKHKLANTHARTHTHTHTQRKSHGCQTPMSTVRCRHSQCMRLRPTSRTCTLSLMGVRSTSRRTARLPCLPPSAKAAARLVILPFSPGKRGLCIAQKRPVHRAKEAYSRGTRGPGKAAARSVFLPLSSFSLSLHSPFHFILPFSPLSLPSPCPSSTPASQGPILSLPLSPLPPSLPPFLPFLPPPSSSLSPDL